MDILMRLLVKISKLLRITFTHNLLLYRALRFGVAASIEHKNVLQQVSCKTIVDIGANRGQFALIARHMFPGAEIISFEPLSKPSQIFRRIFISDTAVRLHETAVGPRKETCTIHVSARDDSSSLLPISALQGEIFPGTDEVSTASVFVAPLDEYMQEADILCPAMLKLDVQGYEYDALRGCESLLHKFDWVYCECSFVELYTGQKLAADVVEWLMKNGFRINGIYNTAYNNEGRAIQSDFLFSRSALV